MRALVTFVLIAALSQSAFAQDDDQPVSIVMPTSANCGELETGPGRSAEDPIEVGLDDLFYDVEGFREFGNEQEYRCRWVRVSGHYRNTNYWHYRGRLFPNVSAFYFPGYSLNGSPRLWIESFTDPSTERFEIESSDIEVVGRFYDLCQSAEEAEAASGEIWLNMGGPCHYSNLNGLMLRDVRIVSVNSDPEQRMRGEANRAALGTLVDIPDTHPDRASILSAFRIWIETVNSGESALLDHLDREDARERALVDETDWTSFLTRPASPARDVDLADLANEIRIFTERRDLEDLLAGDRSRTPIIACACLADTCDDAWPLFEEDTRYFHTEYLCVTLYWRNGSGWSAWN